MTTTITIPLELSQVNPTVAEIRGETWFVYTILGSTHGTPYLGFKQRTGQMGGPIKFTFVGSYGPWHGEYPNHETRPFGSVRYLSGVEITALK